MKSRRRWLWRWQHRRLALALALYTLLLLLLVSYVLDLGAGRGRQGQEEPCPSLEGASGGSSWRQQQQQQEALQHQEKDEQGKPREPHHRQQHQYGPHEPQQYHRQQQQHEQQHQYEPREPHQPQEQPPATPLDATSPHEGPTEERKDSQGAVGGQKKRHIYLHATWRTGSSFVGELFNQHPDVFYLYEPMWHLWQALYPGDAASLQGALRDMLRSLFRCDFSVLRLYASAASSSFDALSLFPVGGARRAPTNLSTSSLFGWRNNKVICSAPLCPSAPRPRGEVGLVDGASCERSCPPKPLRELEEECRKYPVVVIKDVRLLELGVLLPLLRDPGLDVRVVQLFRDPRAVHNSRLKTKQALLRESIQVLRSRHRSEPRALLRRLLPQISAPRGQQSGGRAHNQRADFFLGGALEVICQGWHRDLLFSRDAPSWIRSRYTQLRYEDLVRDPRRELRRLLSFADLPAPSDLEDFVVNMTRGDAYSSDRPFHISARDAREAVHAWRERLSQQQVSQVEAACGEAMALLAYPLSSHVQGDPDPPPHPG